MLSRVSRASATTLSRSCATARNASTLVVAEHNNQSLGAGTLHAVTAASALGGDVTVLIAGNGCGAVAQEAAAVAGVSKVLLAEDAALEKGIAENMTNCVKAVQEAGAFSHIIAPSNNDSKNWIPRLAAVMDTAPLSDVLGVIDEDTFVNPMYAGNSLATVKLTERPR